MVRMFVCTTCESPPGLLLGVDYIILAVPSGGPLGSVRRVLLTLSAAFRDASQEPYILISDVVASAHGIVLHHDSCLALRIARNERHRVAVALRRGGRSRRRPPVTGSGADRTVWLRCARRSTAAVPVVRLQFNVLVTVSHRVVRLRFGGRVLVGVGVVVVVAAARHRVETGKMVFPANRIPVGLPRVPCRQTRRIPRLATKSRRTIVPFLAVNGQSRQADTHSCTEYDKNNFCLLVGC